MSEQIDWSKAPEGYPVWVEDLMHGEKSHGWHKEEDGKWIDQTGRCWEKSAAERGNCRAHYKPSWLGDGMPPVGLVCEVNPDKAGWRKSVISYVGDGFIAWLQVGDLIVPEYGAFIDDCEFRPIRTHEQIAADERESAIKEMIEIGRSGDGGYAAFCIALYDAGLRFTKS